MTSPRKTELKTCAFGLFNNPDYRQEPWKEAIRQRLLCFDFLAFACGHPEDEARIRAEFPNEVASGRIRMQYREWPFPEWSYEELPRHLNIALAEARETGADWGMRLDLDTALHESDEKELRQSFAAAEGLGKIVVTVEKYQFFKPTLCYQKGKMPLGIKLSAPIAYGFDLGRYNDLCQPIEWDGKTTFVLKGNVTDIPLGRAVLAGKCLQTGVHVWNYDYTFRTHERSRELLYWIEIAHDEFWGGGYTGKHGVEITRETSMADFLQLSAGRWRKMLEADNHKQIEEHPRHFQEALRALVYPQWGYCLWGKAVQ